MNNWKKVFGIIWTGQFVSLLSSTIISFAIILWLSIKTGSGEVLAFATIATLLPQTVMGPFVGVFIDRWKRRYVMIFSDLFVALCSFILAIMFRGEISDMKVIYLLLSLRSIGSAFHLPAMQASVPLLAPADQLTRIAGINQMINSIGNIAGPALGGALIMVWKMEYIAILDVLGALIGASTLLFVKIPDPERSRDSVSSILKEMKEGANTVLKNKGLSLMFLYTVIVTFFLMPVSILFPLMTLQHFGGNPFQVSLIEVLWGAGMLAGGAVMGAKVYKISKVTLINMMYILLGLCFFLSGILNDSQYILFAVLTTIAGGIGAIYSSAFTAVVQTNVDPVALGRVFSIYFTACMIPSMIGMMSVGFIADSIGLTLTFVVCGLAIMLTGLVAFMTLPRMKSLL